MLRFRAISSDQTNLRISNVHVISRLPHLITQLLHVYHLRAPIFPLCSLRSLWLMFEPASALIWLAA